MVRSWLSWRVWSGFSVRAWRAIGGPPSPRSCSRCFLATACPNGVYPDSFEEIEPVLEANYGVKASISRVSQDKYHVKIVTSDGAACTMGVKYVITSDGVWEDYDGKILEGCGRY